MIDSFYTSGNSSLFQIELIILWTSEGRLHNEELNDLYSSPNTIQVIKSRRMRMARHVAHMGGTGVHTGFWWGNLRQIDHLEDPDIDRRIILRWIFKKCNGRTWTGLIWLRTGTVGEFL